MASLRPETVLPNMANVQDNEATPKDVTKPPKKHDTLFGPNIGIVSSGPEWTEVSQDKTLVDELTPEIVKGWVAKSKEVRQGFISFAGHWDQPALPDFPTDDYSSSSCESQATQSPTVPSHSFRNR